MPFETCCPGVKYPGDDCPPVWGNCGHSMHMQCIMKVSIVINVLIVEKKDS